MNKRQIRPNFFIVGAPKAGTTSLYNYLSEHPSVFMSRIKETNYFSFNEIVKQGLFYDKEQIRTLRQYEKLFNGVTNERAIGEASVSYLFYKNVPKKLYEYNPQAKIIIVLRNPLDRGYSHYLMDKRIGLVDKSYADIVKSTPKDQKDILYYQQYVELGFYYEQVKRYLDTFESKNVKIFFFDELMNNLSDVVADIYKFLDVDSSFKPNLGKAHNSFVKPRNLFISKLYQIKQIRKLMGMIAPQNIRLKIKDIFFSSGNKPVLSEKLRSELVEIYKNDIRRLEELLNIELSHWYKTS